MWGGGGGHGGRPRAPPARVGAAGGGGGRGWGMAVHNAAGAARPSGRGDTWWGGGETTHAAPRLACVAGHGRTGAAPAHPPANSIEPGQTAWMCRLAWLYAGGKAL